MNPIMVILLPLAVCLGLFVGCGLVLMDIKYGFLDRFLDWFMDL